MVKDEFEFSELEISYALDYIRATCVILPTPSTNEFKNIDIRDKSNRPFVCSAMRCDLVLLVDDEKTFHDAGKYVTVARVPKD